MRKLLYLLLPLTLTVAPTFAGEDAGDEVVGENNNLSKKVVEVKNTDSDIPNIPNFDIKDEKVESEKEPESEKEGKKLTQAEIEQNAYKANRDEASAILKRLGHPFIGLKPGNEIVEGFLVDEDISAKHGNMTGIAEHLAGLKPGELEKIIKAASKEDLKLNGRIYSFVNHTIQGHDKINDWEAFKKNINPDAAKKMVDATVDMIIKGTEFNKTATNVDKMLVYAIHSALAYNMNSNKPKITDDMKLVSPAELARKKKLEDDKKAAAERDAKSAKEKEDLAAEQRAKQLKDEMNKMKAEMEKKMAELEAMEKKAKEEAAANKKKKTTDMTELEEEEEEEREERED